MRAILAIVFAAAICGVHAGATVGVLEFPFEYREGLIWLQVPVREFATPLNFLLDSGAGVSVINLPTLQRLGHVRGRRISVLGVGATTVGYWPQRLTAAPGAPPLPKAFLAVDLSELSHACNREVDGLMGEDFLEDHMVQIDFGARIIRVVAYGQPGNQIGSASPRAYAQPDVRRVNPATAREVSLPISRHGKALLVPISVNGGGTNWVRLDTGCANGLHWVTADVRPESCTPHVSVALTRLIVPIMQASVRIGSVEFGSVPVGVHKHEIFAGEAGLLGNGLLCRFASVTIDVRGDSVILEPVAAGVAQPQP